MGGGSWRKERTGDSSSGKPRAVIPLDDGIDAAKLADSTAVPTPPAWPANWLAPLYIALILVGFRVLWSDSARVGGGRLPADRAMFMAVNAVTLTGFSEAVHVADLKLPGQLAIFCLTIAGSLISMFVAGLAVSRVARRPYSWRLIMGAAVIAEVVAVFLGMWFLWGQDRTPWQAAFQAAAAFGNSGCSIGALPSANAWQTHLILLPWSMLGGIGLPVLIDLFYGIATRRPLSAYSLTAIRLAAVAYLIGVAFLMVLQLADLPFDQWTVDAIRARLIDSSVLCIESRTLGMPIVAVDGIRHTMQWGLLLLMAAGGLPGGTSGGLKITTIAELVGGIRGALSGRAIGRSTAIAATWLAMYAGIVFVTVILTLRTDPRMPGDQLLFDAVSAVSNVGLSHHEMAASAGSMFSLAAAMLLGRLTSTFVLWWLVDTTPSAELPIG
jgi:trk system potassium uptake protein TrkH